MIKTRNVIAFRASVGDKLFEVLTDNGKDINIEGRLNMLFPDTMAWFTDGEIESRPPEDNEHVAISVNNFDVFLDWLKNAVYCFDVALPPEDLTAAASRLCGHIDPLGDIFHYVDPDGLNGYDERIA